MKKIRITLFIVAVMMASFSLSGQIVETDCGTGFAYKSEVDLDRDGNNIYLRTDCENFCGNDCTFPGASSRIDVTAIYELLRTLGRI